MNYTANSKLTSYSQKLRKTMTKEEKRLWHDFLKSLPVTFNRQKVIGNYIVDFYCAQANLVIEIDGSQHYEQSKQEKDIQRDLFMQNLGLTVLRYSNLDINLNFQNVCHNIYSKLNIT